MTMRVYWQPAAPVRCPAMKSLPIALLAAMAASAGMASADTMYKCTDPNGKISYSDQPCSGKGKTSTLNVIAPQRKAKAAANQDYEDEDGVSLQANGLKKPKETEKERLIRAEEDFQKRLKEREDAEAWVAERRAEANRQARESEERSKQRVRPPKDPKQTVLYPPGEEEE